MKFVADTNFLISATQWENSVGHKVLINIILNGWEIFSTKEILEEFSEVLARDFQYSLEESEGIMRKVLCFLSLVEPKIKLDIVKEDSDDNIVLECAVEAKADYILSYDNHLLKLKEFNGIKIVKPEEFLSL